MTFQERIQLAFDKELARRADAGEPRLTKTNLWKAAGATSGAATHWFKGSNGMDMAACLKVAPLLRVNPQWLYDGTGKMEPQATAERPVNSAVPWPLPAIPREKIEALAKEPAKLERLQGAIALALEQIERDMLVAGKPRSKQAPIASLDNVEDPFPMAPREKMPWEPGWKPEAPTAVPVRLQERGGVVANVAPGAAPAANDRFEKVPELGEVRLAAGEGIENENELATGSIQFRRSFLRSVGADGGRGRVVYAKGNSMEPEIKDGWAVLVVPRDVASVRELVPNSIYAINFDGKMIVKTVTKDRLGRWVARSANSSYPDIALEGDAPVRILGPVVWAGGLLREGDAGQWVRR